MTEQEAVEQAHAEQVQKLTTILIDAFGPTIAEEARHQAEERFQNGLREARAARDRALALLKE